MVLSFTCFLILVAVPLNLLGLSGPTGILFTALNLGQYAFTIGVFRYSHSALSNCAPHWRQYC